MSGSIGSDATPAGHAPDGDSPWAPRLAQETRLQQLDEMIARQDAPIDVEIERAVLLAALYRRPESQQAFIDILQRHPAHFTALNEFGTLLAAMGFIAAACRVFSEAIAHHPTNPIAHVNLANLFLRASKLAEAREHYEAALNLDPDHPQAHQGLGAVLSDLGERDSARLHFHKGFRGHAISTQPYRGTQPPVSLLQLVSSGGGNIPSAAFLDDRVFLTSVIVADFLDPAATLPPHHLIFNAIGDADLCRPALKAAARLIKRTRAPVINDPSVVLKTSRTANARRLGALPGVVTPRTIEMPRATLIGSHAAATIAERGFAFPLLLRSPGFHTGRNFVLVESADELSPAAAGLPGDRVLAIAYLDARGDDGNARKYRAMIVDGEILPLHLAISRNWKVHYFTADMADQPGHRAQDAAFLADMPAVIGSKAMTALGLIRDALGLDYGGIDFGLSGSGEVLLFEANATMVIAPPDPDEQWAYRRVAVAKVLDAVVAMIRRRAAAGAKLSRVG